ncbi:hypothetical protein C2W64_00383 [Brevibacillus laterosporus]|nr:hypothetical protein [Brevibacillus laterosporus]RAP31211.1 hypothetical protein C2W64_00383 [Brevibacillus laterosporus]
MEIKQLIEAITSEVLTRLDALHVEKKPKILVFSPNESEWLAVKSILTGKFDAHSVVSDDLMSKQEWTDGLSEFDVQSFSFILLTGLHCYTLASLALGLVATDNVIIQALLQGKKVYLLQEGIEYRHYRQTAPAHLYELYQSYEQKLITHGVNLIKRGDIHHLPISVKTSHSNRAEEHYIHLDGNSNVTETSEEVLHIKQKVISESVLKKLFLLGAHSFTILPNAILTPLAKDFIRINHITVKKMKEEGKNE